MFSRRQLQFEAKKRKNRILEIHTQDGIKKQTIPFDEYDRNVASLLESDENITYVTKDLLI